MADTIALVTPRYLDEMIGGAETLMQGYAEQLQQRGYAVEVLSTCTERFDPWDNTLPAGPDKVRGIAMRRFPLELNDLKQFWQLHGLLESGVKLNYQQQRTLLRNQVYSPALSAYLRQHRDEYRAVLIAPYPFGVTLDAAAAAGPNKAIWIPCLHNEPMARWTVVREALEGARGILFNTHAEQLLAAETLGIVNPWHAVVGTGVPEDAPPGNRELFRERYSLSGPVIMYAGRSIPQKNVPLLIEMVQRYRREVNPALTLLLVGMLSPSIDGEQPGIRYVGELAREELYDAYAACDLFCQPSLNESFSIVMMEAWQRGRPVLVHTRCPVTAGHIAASGGGWTFDDFASFKLAVDTIINQPAIAQERGAMGRAYVQGNYIWPRVMDTLIAALDRLTAPRPLAAELAQKGVHRAQKFTHEHYAARLEALIRPLLTTEAPLRLNPLITELREQSTVGLPDYNIQSDLPVVGNIIAWLRRNATSHIKEPYLDQLIRQQNQFNQQLIEQLNTITEHHLREQRRLERRIRQLEADVAQLNHSSSTEQEHFQ